MTQKATAPTETYTPMPYQERGSQKVNFGDFLGRAVFKIIFGGAMGTAVGFAVTKATRTSHSLYTQAGGAIGAVVGSYFTWRRQEASQLEVDAVLKDYKDLPGLIRTNEEVAQDNVILHKIVAHQREQLGERPAPQVVGGVQLGRMEEAERAHEM